MEHKWINADGFFVRLKAEETAKLNEEEAIKYADALTGSILKRDDEIAREIGELGEITEANKEAFEALKTELMESNQETVSAVKEVMKAVREQAKVLGKRLDAGEGTPETFRTELKAVFDRESEKFVDSQKFSEAKDFGVTIKATQTYGDIDAGLDFAQMKPGKTDKPVRMPKIKSLFSVLPMSGEFLKYTEQENVARDAQNVAKCAAVTSTTKEDLKVRSIETKMIKDQIDFCRTFISDYPYMEARINKLITVSIALREDAQLLLGDGTGENTFSIDSVSSEFSAANPVAVLTAGVQAPTLVDLILGMETQVIELGEQGSFEPDTVIVNKVDWFLQVQSRKDQNDNYLDGRVTIVNGVPMIGAMQVIWTTLQPQNEIYVFDSTKADVLDRQTLVLDVAFQNKDNWEKQIASILGYVRINFLVENNNKNAFMKCTDVGAALTAITKP